MIIAHCDLSEAEFFRTLLRGIDLRSCRTDALRVTLPASGELRGARVTPLQAIGLARLLGLEIEECEGRFVIPLASLLRRFAAADSSSTSPPRNDCRLFILHIMPPGPPCSVRFFRPRSAPIVSGTRSSRLLHLAPLPPGASAPDRSSILSID